MPGTYELGSIPPFTVWSGDTLTFTVQSKLGPSALLAVRAQPSPAGRLDLNASTGVFSFSPADNDRDDIDIVITAQAGAQNEQQTVTITPQPRLPSEFNTIQRGIL